MKPFLKWAGGKTQLIDEIEKYYPFDDGKIVKYAEPFVGGGAILFDILNKYNLQDVYISDTNEELINTYIIIRDNINELIDLLEIYQTDYSLLNLSQRKQYYVDKRNIYNKLNTKNNDIEKAALMIFLNKTCFNGLYRVNKKGEFNVPMGAYKNPLICDKQNLLAVSEKLQKVKIVCDDYKASYDFIDENTFVYFDPPYRPISKTANFTAYTKTSFDDDCQKELAKYVDKLHEKGAKILVSSSDPKNINTKDIFFDKLYSKYNIEKVDASRMISCKTKTRGLIKELIISNFSK